VMFGSQTLRNSAITWRLTILNLPVRRRYRSATFR
jgi:hypothetical protein